jgi:hypothetical protein
MMPLPKTDFMPLNKNHWQRRSGGAGAAPVVEVLLEAALATWPSAAAAAVGATWPSAVSATVGAVIGVVCSTAIGPGDGTLEAVPAALADVPARTFHGGKTCANAGKTVG